MEEKRIDYNAPFLSVRRFHSSISSESKAKGRSRALNNSDKPSEPVKPPPSASSAAPPRAISPPPPPPPPTTTTLYHNSELTSGPVRNPGVVPFSWEEAPGCPKESTVAATADPQPRILNCSAGRVPQPSSHSAAPVGLRPEASSSKSPDKKGTKEEEQEEKPPVKPKKIQSTRDDCGVDEEDVSPAITSADADGGEEEEDDAFSDALDTLSKADSCLMNCSVSGMTGFTESAPGGGGGYLTGGFPADPQARDFMMGRFLPAAQAVATGSAHNSSHNNNNNNNNNNNTSRRFAVSPSIESRRMLENNREQQHPPRRRPPRFHQHKHRVVVPRYLLRQQHLPAEEESTDDDDEEEEDSYSDAGQQQMKGCGFLPRFCLKASSSCLMNPVPGVRVRAIGGRPLPPVQKRSPAVRPPPRHGSVGKTKKEKMWEAVYRHKLGGRNQMQLEDGSKLASESNHLTYWSTDSQSQDGSSPHCRSTTGGGSLSPYRNDAPLHSPFQEGKGFLGSLKEDGSVLKADSLDSGSRGSEKYFEIQSHLLGKGDSGSESPNCVRTFTHVNSDILESLKPRWSFGEAKEWLDISNEHLEVAARDERICGTLAVEASKRYYTMEAGVSTVAKTDVPSGQYRLGTGVDALAAVELEAQEKDDPDTNLQPLLPPPLPKTPSESWLSRTLPSVSSKNQAPPTFLGIKLLPNKRGEQMSSNLQWETTVKDSRRQSAQMRFSEMRSSMPNAYIPVFFSPNL